MSALKVQALFGKSAKTAPAKKSAAKPAKSSGSGSKSGGWLGSGSKTINLDKWCARGGRHPAPPHRAPILTPPLPPLHHASGMALTACCTCPAACWRATM